MALELDTDKIIEMAAKQAAHMAFEEEELFKRVRENIDARIDKLFSDRLEAAVTAQVDTAIKDAFDREFHTVDSFGRPQGEPTTIAKRLNSMVEGYWQQTVNQQGKAIERKSYGDNITRAEWTMLQICGEDFQKQLKQETVNITGQLKDGLRAELRKWVDSTLSELFRVRSADDQAEGRL